MEQGNGFYVGQSVRLKSSVTTRPSYFNDGGRMDYLFRDRPDFKVDSIYDAERPSGPMTWIVMRCLEMSGETWKLQPQDLEPSILDNREVLYEKL